MLAVWLAEGRVAGDAVAPGALTAGPMTAFSSERAAGRSCSDPESPASFPEGVGFPAVSRRLSLGKAGLT